MKKIISIFLVISFLNLSIVQAAGNTIAVLNFKSQTGNVETDAMLSYGTADTIMSYLGDVEGITVVERSRLKDVLKEQQLSLTGIIDERTAAKVGRILGAKYIVIGSWQQFGGQYLLNARLIDVETAKVIAPAMAKGTEQDVLDMPGAVASKILSKLNISSGHIERETNSLFAFKSYGMAVKSFDEDNKVAANKYASEALKQDPNYTAARKYKYYTDGIGAPYATAKGKTKTEVLIKATIKGCCWGAIAGLVFNSAFPFADVSIASGVLIFGVLSFTFASMGLKKHEGNNNNKKN